MSKHTQGPFEGGSMNPQTHFKEGNCYAVEIDEQRKVYGFPVENGIFFGFEFNGVDTTICLSFDAIKAAFSIAAQIEQDNNEAEK